MADSPRDNDWISRRWQGEGRVVNPNQQNPPAAAGRALPRPSGEGGDALIPGLGIHCAQCRTLDFLPSACDCCEKTFCSQCMGYEAHSCPAAHTRQRLAAVCPICDVVVPTTGGVAADVAVERHIAGGCKPLERTTSYDDRACKYGKCKRRELVKCVCRDCNQNFCFKHRAISDHRCGQKKVAKSGGGGRLGAAAARPEAAAAAARRPQVSAAALAAERRAAGGGQKQRPPAPAPAAAPAPPASVAVPSSLAMQQLEAMGYGSEAASIALERSGGDPNAAVLWLLEQAEHAEQAGRTQSAAGQSQCAVG